MAPARPMLIQVSEEALDDADFPLGVIRLAPDRSVTWFNRALAAMVGADLRPGMAVEDLPLDVLSQVTMGAELRSRFEQERGGSYTLVLRRSDTQAAVHTRIAALPEYDAAGGLQGSIAFVVDDTLKNVSNAMYHAMQEARIANEPHAGARLLREMTELLHELIPFDALMVTVISKDRLHLRRLFESPDPPAAPAPFRWWPMPPFVQRMVSDLQPGVIDLDALYRQPEFEELVKNDAPTAAFRARGFRSCLRFAVHSRGEQAAIVSLLRSRAQPDFGHEHLEVCASLPIPDAVGLAMALDEQQQHQVFLALEGRLTTMDGSAMEIAQWLVDRLRRHCQWEHVSLLRVAEERGRVCLVCQARNQERRLPEDFELSISKGLLGRCVRKGFTVNVPDVRLDPDYEVGISTTRSELVVPLGSGRARWLLNIEATERNAFGAEEQRAVERLMRVAGSALGRAAAREMQGEVMDSVGDAILLTNEMNVIREVNRACVRLLKFEAQELVGQDLASFLPVSTDDAQDDAAEGEVQPWVSVPTGVGQLDDKAAALIRSQVRASEVVRLRRKDGTTVPVLMSTATTPGMFGGKVFIASDLSNKQYLDRVERLVPIFRQLASEIRVPLALASTFLQGAEGAAGDKLAKARAQIRKADVSLARVMHAAAAADGGQLERTTFALDSVLDKLRQGLPDAEAGALRIATKKEPVYVSGAFEQLLFCLETVLSQLLRVQAPGQQIQLRTGVAEAGAFIGVSLKQGAAAGTAPPRSVKQAMLVDAVVPSLMERMGGRYLPPSPANDEHRLVLACEE